MKRALLFLKKRKTKIFSFLCGIFIWFLVVTENEYESIVSIPIKTINLKPGFIIANEIPARADVLFRGKGRALMALHLARRAAVIADLKKIDGQLIRALEAMSVETYKNYNSIKVLRIVAPDTFTILIDKLAEKSIPVAGNVKINPSPGYIVVGGIHFYPDSVVIHGPSNILDKITHIQTEHIIIDDCTTDLKEELNLIPFEDTRIELECLKTVVMADVQKLLQHTFTGIPIRIKNLPPRTIPIIIPSTIDITIVGGEDQIIPVKREDIVAYIDYSKKPKANERGFPAFIETPPGVNYHKIKPDRFKVIVEKNKG